MRLFVVQNYGVLLGLFSISHVRLYKGERVLNYEGTIVIRCVGAARRWKGEGAILLRKFLGSSQFKLIGEDQYCLRFS